MGGENTETKLNSQVTRQTFTSNIYRAAIGWSHRSFPPHQSKSNIHPFFGIFLVSTVCVLFGVGQVVYRGKESAFLE